MSTKKINENCWKWVEETIMLFRVLGINLFSTKLGCKTCSPLYPSSNKFWNVCSGIILPLKGSGGVLSRLHIWVTSCADPQWFIGKNNLSEMSHLRWFTLLKHIPNFDAFSRNSVFRFSKLFCSNSVIAEFLSQYPMSRIFGGENVTFPSIRKILGR